MYTVHGADGRVVATAHTSDGLYRKLVGLGAERPGMPTTQDIIRDSAAVTARFNYDPQQRTAFGDLAVRAVFDSQAQMAQAPTRGAPSVPNGVPTKGATPGRGASQTEVRGAAYTGVPTQPSRVPSAVTPYGLAMRSADVPAASVPSYGASRPSGIGPPVTAGPALVAGPTITATLPTSVGPTIGFGPTQVGIQPTQVDLTPTSPAPAGPTAEGDSPWAFVRRIPWWGWALGAMGVWLVLRRR